MPGGHDEVQDVEPLQQSFLKLNSDAGSMRSATRLSKRSFVVLRRYAGWAIVTALVLLVGQIIAFLDISPILIL